MVRRCSRTACGLPAVATLTYVYADSTAVLGPLADVAVPGAFDLCAEHASRTSVPMGWEVIRLPLDRRRNEPEADDELVALANAVREIGLRDEEDVPTTPVDRAPAPKPKPRSTGRRKGGHLRLLPTVE
ncbi:DUF3499 domain-containing protein [Arachnia propionica]|uniref:DUF3499 domain-containing protein n=1 Tax=Arachnia propionica TaxID=1750 RepID=UPI003C6FA7AB